MSGNEQTCRKLEEIHEIRAFIIVVRFENHSSQQDYKGTVLHYIMTACRNKVLPDEESFAVANPRKIKKRIGHFKVAIADGDPLRRLVIVIK